MLNRLKQKLTEKIFELMISFVITISAAFGYFLLDLVEKNNNIEVLNQAITYLSEDLGKEEYNSNTVIKSLSKNENVYTIEIECKEER